MANETVLYDLDMLRGLAVNELQSAKSVGELTFLALGFAAECHACLTGTDRDQFLAICDQVYTEALETRAVMMASLEKLQSKKEESS